MQQDISKKNIDKDEKETSSDCKVGEKSNDLKLMLSHHDHEGFDFKFDNVPSTSKGNDDSTVRFYSRGRRMLFHVSSGHDLVEEVISSRIRMTFDGPVTFLQCTSLPFNKSKLNGAFLVFRSCTSMVWRLGFVVKFSYDATDLDNHKLSLYEWVGDTSICGTPDFFSCKTWEDMSCHLKRVTYLVDELTGYFVNQVMFIYSL